MTIGLQQYPKPVGLASIHPTTKGRGLSVRKVRKDEMGQINDFMLNLLVRLLEKLKSIWYID